MREALEGRAEAERTRRDYDRVLDALRAVYHGNARDPHADASVAAVAELLAEQGRLFEDRKASLDAIGEYEFLRRAYPGSRHRESALLTEGEIYGRDLGDRANARGIFASFLRLYPRSPLAAEARHELGGSQTPKTLRAGQSGSTAGAGSVAGPPSSASSAASGVAGGPPAARHRTVLDAARASQQGAEGGGAQQAAGKPGGAVGAAAQAPGGSAGRDTLVERDLPSGAPPAGSAGRAAPVRAPATVPALGPAPAATGVARGQEPARETALTEAALSAPPPARRGKLPLVTGVRHWSTPVYTRVAIDLQDEVQYEASRAPNPDRIFFDLHGAKLSPELIGKAVTVTDGGYLKRIRAAQFSGDVVRVVLDVSDVSEYSAFFLPNPSRLIVDIHGSAGGGAGRHAASVAASVASGVGSASGSPPGAASEVGPGAASGLVAGKSAQPVGRSLAAPRSVAARTAQTTQADALSDVATLDREPNTVRATRRPTTAPVAASVANTRPAPQATAEVAAGVHAGSGTGDGNGAAGARGGRSSSRAARGTPSDVSAQAIHAPEAAQEPALAAPKAPPSSIRAAAPTAAGERSMVRALGLKIGRIVLDAGHGGHDSGTLGPGGIEEKDVVLDVSLRLGRLLKQRLGADVIYTRDDDTFIPLETRTAIANRAQADLFLSVHANSSQDASARGVETYYLNFTSSADALEVAARENAVSDQSIHQLSDLVKKITLQDKIAESREFAGDVEQSLYAGLENGNAGLKDRGVKKAPFVVLIGANMPSILAEISFLTNPDDARQLRDGEYRQRIAESLYRGVARYVGSLSGVRLAQEAGRPTGR